MDALEIRRVVTVIEDRLSENGREIQRPIRVVGVIAIIKNPWLGRGFVEDLKPEIDAYAPELGALLADRVMDALGSAAIESYGKAAMVGVDGELEHAVALVHTLKFGNPFRERSGGTRLLHSTSKRGGPGTGLDLPLSHITDDDARTHYQNFEIRVPDAPRGDEILVCLSGSDGGRPHPRIGNRAGDEAELGKTYAGQPVAAR
jgi:Amino acid synthesis